MAFFPDNVNEKRSLMTSGFCLIAFFVTVSHRAFHNYSLNNCRSISYSNNLRPLESSTLLVESIATPKIAWLMSYPNSGSSYTLTLVQRTSNYAFATNYGDEVTAPDDFSLPIAQGHPEGPYWMGLSGKLGTIRRLPPEYVMVKTHCGSRCVHCGPREYTETLETFTDACRLSSGRMAPDRHRELFFYSTDRVHKVIHLIRNPFHNMVARYRLDRKNRKTKTDWRNDHPDNSVGFQKWCLELDTDFVTEEHEIFEDNLLEEMHLSPCHSEVFKYVQWHNLAFSMVEALDIPSLTVFYEDYEMSFNETVTGLLEFLDFPARGETLAFSVPNDFDKYFSRDEQDRVKQLAKRLASKRTWESIEPYFD